MNFKPTDTNAIIRAPHALVDFTTVLDNPAWLSAEPIQITRKWSGEDAPQSRHAEARIIWTDEAMLARFVCRQEEPLIINSSRQLETKTIGLWHKDVCEVFVAPGPETPGRYFEFEASPLGEWVDLAITFETGARQTDFEFHSGMAAAAIVEADKIIVAMQIPWSQFLPRPERGDFWRVNLFRCVGVGDDRYLAWQPTYAAEPNFHVPEAFGWLEFL